MEARTAPQWLQPSVRGVGGGGRGKGRGRARGEGRVLLASSSEGCRRRWRARTCESLQTKGHT